MMTLLLLTACWPPAAAPRRLQILGQAMRIGMPVVVLLYRTGERCTACVDVACSCSKYSNDSCMPSNAMLSGMAGLTTW